MGRGGWRSGRVDPYPGVTPGCCGMAAMVCTVAGAHQHAGERLRAARGGR